MIRPDNRFDDYAYRVGEFPLSKELTERGTLEDGVMVTLNKNAELIIADGAKLGTPGATLEDGTTGYPQKAYICTTSNVAGRNQVSGKPFAQGTILIGPACLWIDTVKLVGADEKTPLNYTPGMPLYVAAAVEGSKENGYLTSEKPADNDSAPVVGYAMSCLVPEANTDGTYTLNDADGYVKQDGRNYRAFLRVQFVA